MARIEELIDLSLRSGVMTQDEHNEVLRLIQEDGQIDEHESAVLSGLFAAIESGKIRLVERSRNDIEHRQQLKQKERDERAEKIRAVQETQAARIDQAVDRAIEKGEITEKEHDLLMKHIHADGQIDELERKTMSRLFDAVQSGRVTIVSNKGDGSSIAIPAQNCLQDAKREAIARDQTKDKVPRNGNKEPDQEQRDKQTAQVLNQTVGTSKLEPTEEADHPGSEKTGEDDKEQATEPFDPVHDALSAFMNQLRGRRDEGRPFQLNTDRVLDIKLNGKIYIKTGSMVGYYGSVKFTREAYAEFGVGKMLKKAVTGEGASLTRVTGQGNVFLADQGKKISIIDVNGASLVVNGKNLLAFEDTVKWDITYLRQIAAVWAGGFFNMRLSGRGLAAITTHYDPIVLKVTPLDALMTDVNATVAWSGSLAPTIKTDIAAKSLVGRTSGETFQMRFQGEGFVVIQPFEEIELEKEPGDKN